MPAGERSRWADKSRRSEPESKGRDHGRPKPPGAGGGRTARRPPRRPSIPQLALSKSWPSGTQAEAPSPWYRRVAQRVKTFCRAEPRQRVRLNSMPRRKVTGSGVGPLGFQSRAEAASVRLGPAEAWVIRGRRRASTGGRRRPGRGARAPRVDRPPLLAGAPGARRRASAPLPRGGAGGLAPDVAGHSMSALRLRRASTRCGQRRWSPVARSRAGRRRSPPSCPDAPAQASVGALAERFTQFVGQPPMQYFAN